MGKTEVEGSMRLQQSTDTTVPRNLPLFSSYEIAQARWELSKWRKSKKSLKKEKTNKQKYEELAISMARWQKQNT